MSKNIYFPTLPNLLPKNDIRYKKWYDSLKKRPPPWNKGLTKENNSQVKKISDTFKRKNINNFLKWRYKMIQKGEIIPNRPPLIKSSHLALLTGLILGDGNIHRFPRTEKLTITLGLDKPNLILFTETLVEEIFKKKPKTLKHNTGNAVRIYIYQKQISERLEIPSGNRRYSTTGIPRWTWKSKEYLISCLRGLFEAEGSLSIHLPTYTYNFAFSNRNIKLLDDVRKALVKLGFHPEIRPDAIRLRRKEEVKYFKNLINFRRYDIAG